MLNVKTSLSENNLSLEVNYLVNTQKRSLQSTINRLERKPLKWIWNILVHMIIF
nr:MAG TPA: hypothetical protein [Caudoviricetes sp.]